MLVIVDKRKAILAVTLQLSLEMQHLDQSEVREAKWRLVTVMCVTLRCVT